MKPALILIAAVTLGSCLARAQPTSQPATRSTSRPATQPADAGPPANLPYTMTRFAREGPITGVVVKLDLTDPRVRVVTALTDPRDPDGDGPAVGKLDTMTAAAARQDLEIAMNASFFAVTSSRVIQGKKVGYFVGNGGYPVGWLRVDGKTIAEPRANGPRACIIVHDDKRITIEDDVREMPATAKYAVSGNVKVLTAGKVTVPANDTARHPRSVAGVSADGKTLILMAIDGRRPTVSRGVTYAEEAALLLEFGASDGLNLDGGGSTVMVIKDLVTGVHAIANKPSEFFSLAPALESVQRPNVDLIGVQIDE